MLVHMSFIERIIHRPVLASVMSLLIIIFGLIGYDRLSLRRYPDVSTPSVTVEVKLEGASPLVMEKMITAVLEKALLGLEGLNNLTSSSTSGTSRIAVHFNRGYDIDKAVIDVRNRVGRVRHDLPRDIQPVQITKTDLEDRPLIWLVLTSDRQKIEDLADYAKVFLSNRLEAIPGVAAVSVAGAGNYEVKILLNPLKMANNGVSVAEVMNAVKAQHVREPGGSINSPLHRIALTIDAKLVGEDDFNDLVIKQNKDYIIRLRDIGKAEIIASNKHGASKFNGKPAVSISVKKQATANQLEIIDKVRALLPEMQRYLPTGSKLEIAHDATIGVRSALNEVKKTVLEAFLLVSLIVVLVFGSLRVAIIPVVAIPISLIGACFFMYALGFSLNLLTLLAFVLAIGLVVDDAIVVLENVHRYIEQGMKPLQAAIKGSREIQFAVIAMTVTLAAVYAPIAITQGLVGALFREFALTLVITVLISGFVALTLSPVMCAYILKSHEEEKKSTGLISKILQQVLLFFDKINSLYSVSLKFVLAAYARASIIAGVIFALLGGAVMWNLTSVLFPKEDLGTVVAVMLSPASFTLERTLKYTKKIDAAIADTPGIAGNLLNAHDIGRSTFFISLKDWHERDLSSHEIAAELKEKLSRLPVGLRIEGSKNPFAQGEGGVINVVIKGRTSDKALERTAHKLVPSFGEIPGVKHANTFANNGREIKVTINREKAALLGIKPNDIATALATLWKGKLGGKYSHQERQVDIIVSLEERFKNDLSILSSIFLKGQKGRECDQSAVIRICGIYTY